MDDTQRVRLMILGLSGLLLIGGGAGWVWYHNSKTAEEPTVEGGIGTPAVPTARLHPAVRTRLLVSQGGKPLPVGGQPPLTAGLPSSTNRQAGPFPVLPGGAPMPRPQPAAIVAQGPNGPKTPVALPSPGSVPTATSQGQPGANPFVRPGSAITGAAPSGSHTDIARGQMRLPSVRQQPASQPRQAPDTTLQPAASPFNKSTVASSPTNTAVAPAPADGSVVTPAVASGIKPFPATTMALAQLDSRSGAGRVDPALPVLGLLPFPRDKKVELPGGPLEPPPTIAHEKKPVPPPPPKIDETLVPPPPPPSYIGPGGAAGSDGGVPLTQLPEPPSKPTIADKMKLLGVMDNRAILAFPSSMTMKNKWPKTISLGVGEQFESINLVAVNKDGITIEEDGERSVKSLEPVK